MEDARKLIRTVSRRLRSKKGEPDFFELVRRIQAVHPQLPKIGTALTPDEEALRFGQLPALRFPETAIASIEEHPSLSADKCDALILVYFFGLFGVNGPLPLEMTSLAFERYYNEYDSTIRRFADIIHHRMLSLFFRAWQEPRLAASFDQPRSSLPDQILRSIAGQPLSAKETDVPQFAGRSYAGLLMSSTRSADGLAVLLRSFLGVPLKIRERVRSREDIPDEYRGLLGRRNCRLGVDLQVGSTFLTRTKVFEIVIGPADFKDCEAFLPGTFGFKRLADMVRLYLLRPLDWRLRFLIKTDTIPQVALDGKQRLGRGIWIGGGFRDKTKYTEITQDGARRLLADWEQL